VKLWDAATGQELRTLKGHTDRISSVAFSPDSQRLASASADSKVKIWDAPRGEELRTLKEPTGWVTSVAFSSDGQRLASANWDQTLKVWDARPLSPEVQTEREALGLLEFLFVRTLLKEDVIERIRDNRTIQEVVRERALALAEQYAEDALRLNDASWEVVRQPGANAAAYRLALREAEAASRLKPGIVNYVNTLGVAQYRVCKYKEALDTLTRSDKMNSAQGRNSIPDDLAFLAMAHYQLGQKEKAQASLNRLREIMMQPELAKNEQAQAFLREAEALVKEKPAEQPTRKEKGKPDHQDTKEPKEKP
jgi:tetratricopeptide (TPR) repeat protein